MTAEETPSPTPSTLVATSDFAAPPAVYVALAVLHTVFVCVILVAYYLRRNLQPLKVKHQRDHPTSFHVFLVWY